MNRRVACALACCIAFSAQASLIINGSFEEPVIVAPAYDVHLSQGSTALTGWEIGGTGGPIGILRGQFYPNVNFNPKDGYQHLVFNSADVAAGTWIRQSFDTVPGVEYVVSFYVARSGGGGGDISITVSAEDAGGQLLASLNAAPPSLGLGYGAGQVFRFTATTESSRLKITDGLSATYGVDVVIDAVTVNAVPEPSTIIAGLCCLGIMGASSWRKRV